MLILTFHPISVQCSSFTDTEHSAFPSDVSLLSLAMSKSRFCSWALLCQEKPPAGPRPCPGWALGSLPLPPELGIQGATQGPPKGTSQVI